MDFNDWSRTNPAEWLPIFVQLIPDDPEIERLPKKYIGTDQKLYGENYDGRSAV